VSWLRADDLPYRPTLSLDAFKRLRRIAKRKHVLTKDEKAFDFWSWRVPLRDEDRAAQGC